MESKRFSAHCPSKVDQILKQAHFSSGRHSEIKTLEKIRKFIGPRSNRMLKIGVDLAKFIF